MMNNRYSALYACLVWLLMISYSHHISCNPLLVLFSPLGLIPSRYLFTVDGALNLPTEILIGFFVLLAATLVGALLTAWHSRNDGIQISLWISTVCFGVILVLVDRIVNQQLESWVARLIASWTPSPLGWVTLLFLGGCLGGLVVLSSYCFRKAQISNTGFIVYLGCCLLAAGLMWSMRVPRFEFKHEFSEGLARVLIYGQWGYVDSAMRVVIPPQFSFARPFKGGLAAVEVWSSRNGFCSVYIDKTGEIVPGKIPSAVHDSLSGDRSGQPSRVK